MQTWGCNFDIELRVVQQTVKRMRRGGVTDDTAIDFHFEDWAPSRYTIVEPITSPPSPRFLPTDPSVVDMSRTFKEVKKFLRKRLGQSYPFQFANANGTATALGALPGTEGDDEKTGFRLMKVCAKYDPPECPVGFANLFDFYKKQIGIGLGDRGYGFFDPPTVQKLAADIAASGP
jgi:hypothetical protein